MLRTLITHLILVMILFISTSCAHQKIGVEVLNNGKYTAYIETQSGNSIEAHPGQKIVWQVDDGSINEKMRVIISCPEYPYFCMHWWTVEEDCIESIESNISLLCEEGDEKCNTEGNCYVLFKTCKGTKKYTVTEDCN